jgi:hypothetical protein
MINCPRPPTPPATAQASASHQDSITNETTGDRRRWCRVRPWHAGGLAVTVGLVLLTAACSGSHSSSGRASSTGTGGGSYLSKELAFSRCVRAHGVTNFPDPLANGRVSVRSKQILDTNPRGPAAVHACVHLLPIGERQVPSFTAQQRQDYLRAAACMRSHGIANFPDPVFSGDNVNFPIPSSIDTNSEQFTQARHVCASLIPAGLPFSPPGG